MNSSRLAGSTASISVKGSGNWENNYNDKNVHKIVHDLAKLMKEIRLEE